MPTARSRCGVGAEGFIKGFFPSYTSMDQCYVRTPKNHDYPRRYRSDMLSYQMCGRHLRCSRRNTYMCSSEVSEKHVKHV